LIRFENMGQFTNDKDISNISKHNNKPLALLQPNANDLKHC